MLNFLKQCFRRECIAKHVSTQVFLWMILGQFLWCFPEASGVAFLILAALETGLEIKWCFKVTLGRHDWGGGKKVGLDPH